MAVSGTDVALAVVESVHPVPEILFVIPCKQSVHTLGFSEETSSLDTNLSKLADSEGNFG